LRPFHLDPDVGAEMLEQTLGVIAARLGFDDGRFAGRGKASEQHRRLDLRRRHGCAIDDGYGIARAGEREGEQPAVGHARGMRPDEREGIEDALHRPLAQAGIAVEGRGDGAAADRPHDQAAAGAGIAEIEHAMRFAEAADADAVNAPCACGHALDLGAQRAHRLAGVDHVLAFEQPGYAGFPDRERAEDEGAVRDRFVAGRARAALEGARAAGGERGFGGVVHGRTRLGTRSLAWGRKGVIRGAMAARDGARLAAIDTAIATRQVKHLILDPLKEPEPWRNPSSAPSASAAIAAQNSTISARIQSSARNATPSWSSRRSTRGRDRSPRPLPTLPPRRRRKKRWWRRRPPRDRKSTRLNSS